MQNPYRKKVLVISSPGRAAYITCGEAIKPYVLTKPLYFIFLFIYNLTDRTGLKPGKSCDARCAMRDASARLPYNNVTQTFIALRRVEASAPVTGRGWTCEPLRCTIRCTARRYAGQYRQKRQQEEDRYAKENLVPLCVPPLILNSNFQTASTTWISYAACVALFFCC